jgi:hypothetical protein
MHDMTDTLGDIGISASTAQAARAAKLAAWKVMLQDWREVGPHTTVWTAERDEDARKLAAQQQEFNENPFSDENLQMRWAMLAKADLQEDATEEEVDKALDDLSCIDITEPDQKHNGAAMRNKRLAPIWDEEQGIEITGLFEHGCLKKVKRSDLPAGTRVIGSRFHYKIKRHSAGKHKTKVKRLKVQVVVQGQHMSKDKGDFKDAFSPQGPSYIYDDLRSVICMGENPSNRKGARHIDSREHFVDQLVKDRIVKLQQCRTNKMVADALTKNLPAPAFEQHRATMLGEDEASLSAMLCRARD